MINKRNTQKSIKNMAFVLIEKEGKGSKLFNYSIVLLILINIAAIILESFQTLQDSYGSIFKLIEYTSVYLFSLEYILRLWVADLRYPNRSKWTSRLFFAITPMALIDLMAILPFYLPMLIPFDLRILRLLRVTRLIRIFKLNRYSKAFILLSNIIKRKKAELAVTIFTTLVLLLLASTLMYYIEGDVQPEAFPNIIASLWWAVATLTTVGYGDIYPITGLGRLLSGIIAVLGIGLVALPTGIISSGFMEEFSLNKVEEETVEELPRYCAHCGKGIVR
ncbi:hypothetical protein GCM10012290_01750 [Halolactibacillus alkaliphilus]|uniref:Ion transport domain-containing protein n=1 Tax=Halolactibacillus alkaliphilus TaxID=442899 RepID=A0A511X0I0_9BACI|nr:ion transporter [Halolactibacillus alkaliphilus]GEN56457.1 hypothetical protein HAL01_09210 [Halolactibacillus alkaliphilus]GGN64347.1 hypothetical protein GCM10012290_01750 [Halolactibacillus alkaliphilus]SFO61280.1 voltage-gated potassium channel [Halolactibacillus alkaliphilus]